MLIMLNYSIIQQNLYKRIGANMEKLKRVGFFKELKYASQNDASIHDVMSNIPCDYEDKILEYLNQGSCFVVAAGISRDIMDNTVIGGLSILSDGE